MNAKILNNIGMHVLWYTYLRTHTLAQTSSLVACAHSGATDLANSCCANTEFVSFMYELSSTEEVITFCSTDFSIRSNAKGLVLEKLDSFVFLLLSQKECVT